MNLSTLAHAIQIERVKFAGSDCLWFGKVNVEVVMRGVRSGNVRGSGQHQRPEWQEESM